MTQRHQPQHASDQSWELIDTQAKQHRQSAGQVFTITTDTARMRVPDGWLYRYREWDNDGQLSVAMAFVPEPVT